MRALWAAVTETPIPTPTSTVDPTLVSPGPIGFMVTALILVPIVFLLVWDMNRRVRRVRYRDEVRAELDAEAAAAASASVVDESSGSTDAGSAAGAGDIADAQEGKGSGAS